jgi:hypothetical protein
VSRPRTARAHGVALALYFVLLPLVVVSQWRRSGVESDGTMVRVLLIALAALWLGFLLQVARNVVRLRRGGDVEGGGSVWLAGLVLAAVALVAPLSHAPTRVATSQSVRFLDPEPAPARTPPTKGPATLVGGVPVALMAKRRMDLLRQPDGGDLDVEESLKLLRAGDPDLVAHLARRAEGELDGVLEVLEDEAPVPGTTAPSEPVVACVLGTGSRGALVGFAHEGGRLPVLPSWNDTEVEGRVVALHEGPVAFAHSEGELLRRLAVRTRRSGVVVYLGDARELDGELAACAITLTPYRDPGQMLARRGDIFGVTSVAGRGDVVVELLRADPQVVGLVEPFISTLRRRCVEMSAYLAVHRHEPVTGERLRTRVLTRADVDASQRTLANTASAVRRSLGVDAHGPRLHPVTSSGLYVTHGVTSDAERFSALVARARTLEVHEAAPLAHEALLLIKGEPLASALRGFEWFLAEGHGARLARDGEWAALALHHASLERGNFELAFWALQQGLLVDPYSDALAGARARVPRLREFGRDRTRRAQHDAVGAGDAVAMSWAFARFRQQVTQ